MPVVEVDDGLLLPILQPEIPRDGSIMLVRFTVALDPCVKLASCNRQPGNETMQGDFRLLAPLPDKINNGVADVMGNPAAG